MMQLARSTFKVGIGVLQVVIMVMTKALVKCQVLKLRWERCQVLSQLILRNTSIMRAVKPGRKWKSRDTSRPTAAAGQAAGRAMARG